MSTTNLFVELLVIGLGASAWVALFLLTALGYDAALVRSLLDEPVLAIPALAAAYLLGIITDRLADTLFLSLRMEEKRRRYGGGADQYFKDRALILANSESFTQQYEYGRSRQRICRGWTFNAVALLVASNLFLVANRAQIPNWPRLSFVTSVLLVAIAFGCWLSWEKLSSTELSRMKDEAATLRAKP